jgi:hypothetical protein
MIRRDGRDFLKALDITREHGARLSTRGLSESEFDEETEGDRLNLNERYTTVQLVPDDVLRAQAEQLYMTTMTFLSTAKYDHKFNDADTSYGSKRREFQARLRQLS